MSRKLKTLPPEIPPAGFARQIVGVILAGVHGLALALAVAVPTLVIWWLWRLITR